MTSEKAEKDILSLVTLTGQDRFVKVCFSSFSYCTIKYKECEAVYEKVIK